MRRACLIALLLAAALAGSAGPAGAAALHLTETSSSGFPERVYALTLGAPSEIGPGNVTLSENGTAVDGLSVVPASSSKATHFTTMLVIDTSLSMHGASIRAAMGAARAFAQQHSPQQSLGLILFNGSVQVAVPPTRDAGVFDRALSVVPRLAPGTHIGDATALALQTLARTRATAGNVIVLSDGTDTGSTVSLAAVAQAAHAAHARIYSIGFRDRAYDAGTLTQLARQTGGQYVVASSTGALKALFTSLGRVLASQYLVSYRSSAPLDSKVTVQVRVAGQHGVATDSYTSPSAGRSASPRTARPTSTSFWDSDLAVALVVGGAALLLGLSVVLLLAPSRSVRSRVGQFVALPGPEEGRDWTRTLLSRAFGEDARAARRKPRSAFREELELAGIKASPLQLALWTLAGTVLLGWLLVSSTGAPGAAILALAVPIGVRIGISVRIGRQRRAFDEQLPDNLQVIASAMRAGQTFLGALSFVATDSPEPSQREFRKILADERIGVPLVDALGAVAERMGSRDFEHVALVASLQRDTGGNTAEVIDQVTETIRERMDLRRIVRTLTAQGRLAGFVVSMLPVLLIIAISLINPDYLHPMFHTAAGIFMLVVAALMLALGARIIARIVDIKI